MMRIVGGKFKGHSIAPPHGSATRPTSDRVRESVFNILAHGIDGLALEQAFAACDPTRRASHTAAAM
jgi:16S rRNA (guanine966-N2)-methyltransferase